MKLKSLFMSLFFVAAAANQLQSAELSDEQKLMLTFVKQFPCLMKFNRHPYAWSENRGLEIVQVQGGDQKDCVSNCNRWFSAPNNQIYMFHQKGDIIELTSLGSHVEELDLGKKVRELNPNQFGNKIYQVNPEMACQMYTVEDYGDGRLSITEGQRPMKISNGQLRHIPGCKIILDLTSREGQERLSEAISLGCQENRNRQQP